jgi:hypothetical protein
MGRRSGQPRLPSPPEIGVQMALPIPNPRREIPLVSLTPKLCASNTNARSIGTSGWSKRAESSVVENLSEVPAR